MNGTRQIEHVKRIAVLKELYPECEIRICVDSDEMSDGAWTAQEISSVELRPWLVCGDYILTDSDEIKEHLADELDSNLTDSEMAGIVDERYAQIKYVICVFTAPCQERE